MPSRYMLGVTTYQEALRALGTQFDRERRQARGLPPEQPDTVLPQLADLPNSLVLIEELDARHLNITLEGEARTLDVEELRALVTSMRAMRGSEAARTGPLSDLLRAVGYALDEVHAISVHLEVWPQRIDMAYRTEEAPERLRRVVYDGDDLANLRRVAAARRNGKPLSRVLVLHTGHSSAEHVREVLAAEFAVQELPALYAEAVSQATDVPEVVIVYVGPEADAAHQALHLVRTLRGAGQTALTPVVAVLSGSQSVDLEALFQAGVDDALEESVETAIMRARVRTWILRGARRRESAPEP